MVKTIPLATLPLIMLVVAPLSAHAGEKVDGAAESVPAAAATPAPASPASVYREAYRRTPVVSGATDGPAIAIDATDVHIGVVPDRNYVRCTYRLRNLGNEELTIKAKPD